MLNNELVGTQSMKLRRITPIKNYICNRIDENQNIKRLSRYLTKTPLMKQGLTYDGKMVEQPDLIGSLLEYDFVDKNLTENGRGEVIIPYGFSTNILVERQISIYVHCPRTLFNPLASRGTVSNKGQHLFVVEVVYPDELNKLANPFGSERALEIACEIMDMFDDYTLDGDEADGIGNIKFQVKDNEILDTRLSSSKYGCFILPLTCDVFSYRTKKSGEDSE